MLTKRVAPYILFWFIVTPLGLLAQLQDSVKKWDLATCLQYASEHNIQVNTLRLAEQSAKQDLLQAKALKLPDLSSALTNTFLNAKNTNPSNQALENQLSSSGAYTLNSSLTIYNANLLNNSIRQRNLQTESARLSVQETQNTITFSITEAYLNILLAKENLKYITDLVNTSVARVKQGQQFYEAGSIAKKDLLQLQAQLAADQYLLVQTQNAIRQNILTLKQILQLSSETPFDIQSPAQITIAAALPPLRDAQQHALLNFPEVKISKLNVNISSLDIAKAKAGFWPVFSANGSIGTSYSEAIGNSFTPQGGYFNQAGDNFYQRLGFTLSIPIFSNRLNKTNVEKANIAYKEAELNQQNTELVLSQQVEQAYLNASNAMQSYDAANQQLISAAESYRISNEQLKLGAVSTVDLLQQRNQYVQAVQAFTQAKYTAVLQQKIYEFYLGIPITL